MLPFINNEWILLFRQKSRNVIEKNQCNLSQSNIDKHFHIHIYCIYIYIYITVSHDIWWSRTRIYILRKMQLTTFLSRVCNVLVSVSIASVSDLRDTSDKRERRVVRDNRQSDRQVEPDGWSRDGLSPLSYVYGPSIVEWAMRSALLRIPA